MKRWVVVIKVQDDSDSGRDWWEALGQPAPERWGSEVGVDYQVWANVELEIEELV